MAEAQALVEMAPRKKAERKPLPAHLPREERILRPNLDACPDCGGKLKNLGEDVSEQLEYAGELPRHPPCASQAGLCLLRSNRAGTGS